MSKKYTVIEEKESLGCCNLVIWDFFFVMYAVWYYLDGDLVRKFDIEIHTVFKLLICFAGGIIPIVLMKIRIIRMIVYILFSTLWMYVFTDLCSDWFHLKDDAIWMWTLRIVFFMVSFGLHIMGMQELGDEEPEGISKHSTEEEEYQIDSMNSLNVLERENAHIINGIQNLKLHGEKVADEALYLMQLGIGDARLNAAVEQYQLKSCEMFVHIWSIMEKFVVVVPGDERNAYFHSINVLIEAVNREMSQLIDEVERVKSKKNSGTDEREERKQQDTDIDESLFSGCRDLESLTKRYRVLMKAFHPDNQDGDTDMTRKIQKTYELMKNKIL